MKRGRLIEQMQRIRVILFLLAPWLAARADQLLTLPDWLAMPQEAHNVTRTASATSVDISYLAPLPPTEVTSRYEQQLQKAAVRFSTSFDGIGNAISASTESISCMLRIADADSGFRVRVACASQIEPASSQAISPSVQSPRAVAAIPRQPALAPPVGRTEIEGWSQARWGMTQKQVLSAFPGEATILRDDWTNRNFGARGIATVGVDSADMGGIPVRVLFFFDGTGKLDGIRFVADTAPPFPTPDASDDQFTRMENALAGVYGAPTLRAASTAAIIISPTRKGSASFVSAWVFPNSVVQLTYIPPPPMLGLPRVLNLSIDKRTNQTAESIMASRPDLAEVRGTHQLWGRLR
jgi:hypothetical protein